MRTLISIASVLVCALSLDAQIVGRVNRLPDGSDQLTIRKTLAAFVLSVKHVPANADSLNGPLVVFSDALIDATATPLQTGEERVFRVADIVGPLYIGRTHLLGESIVTAGILVDGTTTGEPILLGRLIVRRGNMLQAVETAMGILSDRVDATYPVIKSFCSFRGGGFCQPLVSSFRATCGAGSLSIDRWKTYQLARAADRIAVSSDRLCSAGDFELESRLLESEPSLQDAAVLIGR